MNIQITQEALKLPVPWLQPDHAAEFSKALWVGTANVGSHWSSGIGGGFRTFIFTPSCLQGMWSGIGAL